VGGKEEKRGEKGKEKEMNGGEKGEALPPLMPNDAHKKGGGNGRG